MKNFINKIKKTVNIISMNWVWILFLMIIFTFTSYYFLEIDENQKFLNFISHEVFGIILYASVAIYLRRREGNLTQKLLDEKKKLNIFMDAIDKAAIIITTNADGYIIDVNDRFCDSSGYTRQELIGQHTRIMKSGFHGNEYYEQMWETISSGQIWIGEMCNKKKDGSFFWVHGPIIPIMGADGKIEKYMALRQNITEHKKLENQLLISKRQLQDNLDWRKTILDSANYAIIATGKDGVILTFNTYAEKLLGYEASEVLGRTTPLIFHKREELIIESQSVKKTKETELNILMLVGPASESSTPINREMTYVRRDGVTVPMRLSISALRDSKNEINGYLIIGADITIEKKIKAELVQAKELALQGSKVKSEFLASMSHEIRTPLNGIIGMTDQLLESKLNSDQKMCAEAVITSAQTLLTIINDILDFSKIESGKMELERISFNLKTMLIEYLQPLKFTAEKKGLYFNTNIPNLPFEIEGDSARFGQIMSNLIGNAIKFTHRGGIDLDCEIEEERGQEIRMKFVVRDTGIGIPDEAKNRMFQAFSQADRSTARKYGGSGLGLSIVHKLVNLMGGSIQFESIPNIGTTFILNIIFKKGKSIDTLTAADFTAKQQNYNFTHLEGRVLVAEDVATNQQLFARMLKKFGCRFQIVSNGKEVLEALDTNAYDIILMDCQMPDMDGYEATELIRKMNKPLSKIPIVALTANALKGDREKCMFVGMNDYLTKPISQIKLHESLAKYLKKAA